MGKRLSMTMTMRQYGTGVVTDVWHGSALYIFSCSIRQAQRAARFYPLTQGPAVADMWTTLNPDASSPVIQAVSLVWRENTPYLFPGSLTWASHRGKTWRGEGRKDAATALYHRRLEAAGFEEQYGNGIGSRRREGVG